MAQYEKYAITAQRLSGIADQARRLGKVSGKLTPGQIQDTLSGVVSLSNAEETTFGYVKKTETVTEKAPEGKCWYNGVLLPKIPADVLASYPYCWIRLKTDGSAYDLILSPYSWYFTDSLFTQNSKYVWYTSTASTTEWTYNTSYTDTGEFTIGRGLVWSNHDIPNGSATATAIYFKGSEPLTELTETITTPVPVERESNYSITSANLNDIAKRTQEMAGTTKLMTPEDIIYFLNSAKFISRGNATSEFTLTFGSTASG